MFGIDFASVDRDKVDYEALAAAGCEYAILRANYGTWRDSENWPAHAAMCRANSIIPGAYMFWRPNQDPVAQVGAFVEDTRGSLQHGDLVAFDLEFPKGVEETGMTSARLVQRAEECISEFHYQVGCWPLLYSSDHVYRGQLKSPTLAPTSPLLRCALWLANYGKRQDHIPADLKTEQVGPPPVPAPWGVGNFWFRQYQGDAGQVPSVSRYADLNKFFTCRVGDHGEKVRWVQRKLGTVKVDGLFGTKETEPTLKRYQLAHGLPVSGVVDVRTFALLMWETG